MHAPVPVHAPVQRVKREPSAATGVSVSTVPMGNEARHAVPQSIASGAEITRPPPVPLRATDSVKCVRVKLATTLRASLSVTLHASLPLQAPLQPVNTDSAAGAAVKVSVLPRGTSALQVLPQAIAAGAEVIVPLPVPLRATPSDWWVRVKLATTLFASFIATLHVPVPLHAPLQPANTEPAAGLAASATVVPLFSTALHRLPQLMTVLFVEATPPSPLPSRLSASA